MNEGAASMEQQRDNWIETARMYAGNADYWRGRAERAERLDPRTWLRAIRRKLARLVTPSKREESAG